MATRKRRPVEKKSSSQRQTSRDRLRRTLLEKLEERQLLAAGPQLIGIQPNEGALIDTGAGADSATELNVAPRVLTFRFDDGQQIHPDTLDGIRITRAGDDGSLGTGDDVVIEPGSVLVNSPDQNEVLVRFAETLPDDRYRIEVFGYDDPANGIVGLRNTADDGSPGLLLHPRGAAQQSEVREFELRLGALVESVVPQPVVRLADGTLEQRRDQVLVYFNEPLFVESDPSTGEPTDRSADNPRFYQLLFTRESVRNTDDFLFLPTDVQYDAASQTTTLTFAKDLELLIRENVDAGVGGGTFRLRVGSAVNLPAGSDGTQGVPTFVSGNPSGSIDLFFEPDASQQYIASARSSLKTSGDATTTVQFTSTTGGAGEKWNQVRFVDSGAGGLSVSVDELDDHFDVIVDLGGSSPRPTIQALVDLLNDPNPAANDGSAQRIQATVLSGSGSTRLGAGLPAMEPIRLLSDSFASSYDVGSFGDSQVSSLIFGDSISPVPYTIDLPGGPNDPAARDLLGVNAGAFANYINSNFNPDPNNQIKVISYNFGSPGPGLVNSITGEMKERTREALDLWSQYLGVRFVETTDTGLTIALETPSSVPAGNRLLFNAGRAAVSPDPNFQDGLLVLDALFQWQVGYGQNFFRTSFAGIGALLGLGQASDLPPSTVMALSNGFLNGTIDQTLRQLAYNQVGNEFLDRQLEPVFPGNYDVQHGSYLHGQVGSDLDLYRFEVDVTTGSNTGLLTAETFAQRLPDSSSLDTSLKLFKETQAAVETSFSLPVLPVQIEALAPGRLGNETKINFVRSFRSYIPPSDGLPPADEAQRQADNMAAFEVILVQTGPNSFTVDIPFLPDLSLLDEATRQAEIDMLAKTPADMLRAIEADPFASSLVRVIDTLGDNFAALDNFEEFEPVFNLPELPFQELVLDGGGIEAIAFNDDYFGTDSRIQLQLEDGVYYIGVAASGNDQYDAVIPGTGFGGGSEGDYQLFVKFEADADGRDSLRDVDGGEVGVPGTPLDGDGDGVPGGANNFWFQVRPEQRQVSFDGGEAIVPGSRLTVVSGPTSITRTYQFIEIDALGNPVPGQPPLASGNLAIRYRDSQSSIQIAQLVVAAINGQSASTQVSALAGGSVSTANTITLAGERSLTFSSGFGGATVHGRTIFVDKTASASPDGTTASPFNNIASPSVPNAFRSTHPEDIVRIVGNGGNDGRLETGGDNFAYRVGFAPTGGVALEDGTTLDVPKGVTVMVDAGAIFKMRNSRLGVGSSNQQIDRSGAALQVLGTPRLLDSTGQLLVDGGEPVVGNVVFTSLLDATAGQPFPGSGQPRKGDWGGLSLRRDVDDNFGRANLEDQGIFLNHINYAAIRFGGGSSVVVDANQVTVNPIQVIDTQPTITFNEISASASAAMSAAPNSFEEVSYQSPRFQGAGSFTADYERIGPDIRRNELTNNTLNGLFIRVETAAGSAPVVQTVSGRWDDNDIVHILSENLKLAGNAGGALRDGFVPNLGLLTTQVTSDAGDVAAGVYNYRLTMVDSFGFESLPSNPTTPITVNDDDSRIALAGLPQVPQTSDYQFRRLYRSDDGVNYRLVAELNASDTMYVDRLDQADATSQLDLAREGFRGRPASSLNVDPGTVVKIQGSRIEVGFGAQLLAEGTLAEPVIFTSIRDDRFGAGGSFDTNNDDNSSSTLPAAPADWAGIYASPTAHLSLDHGVVAYAGGLARIEGTFKAFNPIELQQATARIANTIFEDNADGIGGQGPTGRFGRLANTPATIFVRGSQPLVVGNTFTDNGGSVIDIDANSISADLNVDVGRQTGDLDRIIGLDDNRGPLVRRNALDNNDLNGMEIRGATLTTESVWDDTDIVHVLYDSIVVDNFHGSGNLRLQSNPNESLVVKLLGEGSPFSDTMGTGFTITGTENDLQDRIGGSVQVLGRPGFPVVMTSLLDDSVGAGRKPNGTEQTDTNNDAFATRPSPNDWRSVFLDETSNDRNVSVLRELEQSTDQSPGLNGTPTNAQVLGELAGRVFNGDDLRRLGFELEGFLSEPGDVDVYQFTGEAGSEVWIDLDRTTASLDTVVELLDANGNVLARSTNSFDEVFDPGTIDVFTDQLTGRVGSLAKGAAELVTFSSGGDYYDFGSTNPRDAGFRLNLPGAVGNRGPYFVRVRSNSVNIDDVSGGLTSGAYRLQVRLGESQEIAGSTVNYADIRYANHGVHVKGLPGTSPLVGDAQEHEQVSGLSDNGTISEDPFTPATRPQYIGNLLQGTDRTVSVGGALSGSLDVDFYRVELDSVNSGATAGGLVSPTVFDIDYADGISRPDTNVAVYYSPTGNPGSARLVLFSEGSNVVEDRAGFLSNLAEDIFRAGSTGDGDPFIGPVALPEGTYYVGITNATRVPSALGAATTVRREPVNSVVRLAEERFYQPGDTIVRTTAADPVVDPLFDTSALPAGWQLTTNRGNDAGHGIPAAFDSSRPATPGLRSLQFDPTQSVPNTDTVVDSAEFSLAGYSAADRPVLYFNYLFNGQPGDDVTVQVVTPTGATTIASSNGPGAAITAGTTWRQARIPLDNFEFQTNLSLRVTYGTGGDNSGEGFYLDDVIIGFAERGEMISGAAIGNATYSGGFGGGVTSGEYQLEMRPATNYFSPAAGPGSSIVLNEAFDTNDRHSESITIVSPAGADLMDGFTFNMGDGSTQLTFEFDEVTAALPNGDGVAFGNIRIPFRSVDSADKVASEMRTSMQSAIAQNGLRIAVSPAFGDAPMGAPSDARINLYGPVVGDFVSINESTTPVPVDPTMPNHIQIPARFSIGLGDANAERAQGQIIVENNFIRDAKVYGVWSDPGDRLIDDTDDVPVNPWLENRHGFGPSSLGAVRNLPTSNDDVVGGLTPGLVIQNNVIDRAGYVGVQIEGAQRPFQIEAPDDSIDIDIDLDEANQFYLGASIPDGFTFAIDAAGTRVVFEFEDISGANTPSLGSNQVGGDGWTAGHVPVYYRKGNEAAPPYNPNVANQRRYPSTRTEVMHSMRDAIIGSILVTNDLVPLVDVWVGPSLQLAEESTTFGNLFGPLLDDTMAHPTGTLFINGASGIYFTNAYSKGGASGPLFASQVPFAETVQPYARVINNTIYGSDGTSSNFQQAGNLEPSDRIPQAIDTKLGRAHSGTPYSTTGTIGDGGGIAASRDVDLYRFHLDVGDRAQIDLSTLDGGPEVGVRLFNSLGEPQMFPDANGNLTDILFTGSAPGGLTIDFTGLESDSYYLGVSSRGNDSYDPLSNADRVDGLGGTGQYDVAIDVLAPRQVVMSLQQVLNFDNLVGTTFTIEQIADLPGTNTNALTFQFVNGGTFATLPNGNIPVNILGGNSYRTGDIMRAMAGAINGVVNGLPRLPNHEDFNGPQGVTGPITRVEAYALGGEQGWDNETGLTVYDGGIRGGTVYPLRPHTFGIPAVDAPSGFGHNRTGQVGSLGILNTFTDGAGTGENYLLLKNVARVTVNNVPNLAVDPQPGRNMDQLVPEVGVMARNGASPSLLNNIILNTQAAVETEVTRRQGFGQNRGTNQHTKPGQVIVGGTIFQHTESVQGVFQARMNWPGANGAGTETDSPNRPSNVNGGTSDFNLLLPGSQIVLVNPANDNFSPIDSSIAIDSAINSVPERDALASLKQALGMPINPLLAPERDVTGQLRVDDPDVFFSGLGSNVFKDRGAVERADFVGPVAVLTEPLDNDSAGNDEDPNISFVQLADGTISEFRIQLRDSGDASDPFQGSGIDDSTVVGPLVADQRSPGATLTLFENGRLLEEGVDYRFSYDATNNVITLRPLAGIWRQESVYEIGLNNRDRFVATAPAGVQINDGDSFVVYDDAGGRVTFEFDGGYQLSLPEVIRLGVPPVGVAGGGIVDGDRVTIDDGLRRVTFEYTTDLNSVVSGNVPVLFAAGQSPRDLLLALQAAIQGKVNDGTLVRNVPGVGNVPTVSPVVDSSDRLRIGMEAGGIVDASTSGLTQAGSTIALKAPIGGVGPAGVVDGDTFTVSDGIETITFEFEATGGVIGGNIPVDIAGVTQPDDVIRAIDAAFAVTNLQVRTEIIGNDLLYLGLPAEGSASIVSGRLAAVSYARTLPDAGTLVFTPASGTPVTLELNRTDEATGDDGVAGGNLPLDFSRTTSADELAAQIASAVAAQPSLGLSPTAPGGGIVALGGDGATDLVINNAPGLDLTSTPGVTESSTLRIFGSLELQVPLVGGSGIPDGTTFSITVGGVTQLFAFNLNLTPIDFPTAIQVDYSQLDTADDIAAAIEAAIDGSPLGINATASPGGRVSLGPLPTGAVDTMTSPLTLRRGVVSDGEQLSITQNGTTLLFEFEDSATGGGVSPGAIPVLFNSNDSTDQVANSLAAAITSAGSSIGLAATNIGNGLVRLTDTPQTVIDISAAPTLSVQGTPGGAIPIPYVQSSVFTAESVKQSIIDAINGANDRAGRFVTSLQAVDRGGDTFFIENAVSVESPLEAFYLTAIKDLVGQSLEPNRADGTTQFTLMLPTVDFDYGDAPDPRTTVAGRYPTLISSDGARHILGVGPRLGQYVDPENNGQPLIPATGDDASAYFVGTPGASFVATRDASGLTVELVGTPTDGDTIRIATVTGVETFELDSDDIFAEANVPVRFTAGATPEEVAEALRIAIQRTNLGVAGVTTDGAVVNVITDDDDGVSFVSATNPFGVFNRNISTQVTVTVDGTGYVDGWVDFNADGDWDDPGEQIFTSEFFSGSNPTRTFEVSMPASAPVPQTTLDTYARFRVSSSGGLGPAGLAIDGEVEDYRVQIVPGSPPVISNPERGYTVDEDQRLIGLDLDGNGTPTPNDDGLLAGVVDPNGDPVEVYPDAGVETIDGVDYQIVGVGTGDVTADGTVDGEVVGTLELDANGEFTFEPFADYFGDAVFRIRVQDRHPGQDPALDLVAPQIMTVSITVNPVNDRPVLAPGADPTLTITDSPEDQVIQFTLNQLIDGRFVAGPENEFGQPMRAQSAGFGGVPNVTRQGGTLQITAGGEIIYTPPTDYNGPDTDEFIYTVVDEPGSGQSPQQSQDQGTVVISFVPVNDPPAAGSDTITGVEDTQLTIPIEGPAGILSNDSPGPQDEIDEGQFVSLVPGQFPVTTVRGGTVELSGDGQSLIYTPRLNFAGSDSFQYQITDNAAVDAATSMGTVTINLSPVNDGAVYGGPDSLTYDESKGTPQTFDIDLNTWFTDPEGDALTYQASSADGTLLQTSVNGNILTLTLPVDQSGDTLLSVTAFNPGGTLPTTQDIPVTVINTPDPPQLIGSLDPTNTLEDQNVTSDLTTVFSDPDGDVLTYRVVTPPGQSEPFDQSLVQNITFNGDEMLITLVPDAFGTTEITLAVTDGMFTINHTFTLNVASQPDVPVASPDDYSVPLRGRLTISDPRLGLLANDTEADGDTFTVDLGSVTQPSNGSVSVNADGTFTYVNISNAVVGATDTFSYQAIDPDGRSNRVTVTIELTESTHQNPVNRLDVNADGSVSPIDALRIVNLLNRSGQSSIPIRDLPAPPDFYDTDGNGLVAPLDALGVINFLNRSGSGGEGEGFDLRLASTTAWVSAGTSNLPQSTVVGSNRWDSSGLQAEGESADTAGRWELVDGHLESAIDWLAAAGEDDESDADRADSVDEALVNLLQNFDWGLGGQ